MTAFTASMFMACLVCQLITKVVGKVNVSADDKMSYLKYCCYITHNTLYIGGVLYLQLSHSCLVIACLDKLCWGIGTNLSPLQQSLSRQASLAIE